MNTLHLMDYAFELRLALVLLLVVVTVLMVLAPWGLESTDFLDSLRAAFFGFQVGGVTISISTVVVPQRREI